jgi:membrane protease YdiL (CAAX protease family)
VQSATEDRSTADNWGVTLTTEDARRLREWWPAIFLFLFAMAVFIAREASRIWEVTTLASGALFAGLTGLTLALSVTACRERLRARSEAVNVLGAPLAITAAIAMCCGVVGLPILPRAVAFGAYLTIPAVLGCVGRGRVPDLVRVLGAAIALWLPIEFDLLPQLRLPPPDGLRAAPFAALAAGLYLFLVACPLDRIGYTFRLSGRDLRVALIATAAFAVVGVPIGLMTGFLEWNPRPDPVRVAVAPIAIYLATGVPEEFLFRGLIQNTLERALGRAALPIASIIFGLAHLPDVRYVLLATLAGVAYGWVYLATRRITASAVTHALVDWIWVLLLRG